MIKKIFLAVAMIVVTAMNVLCSTHTVCKNATQKHSYQQAIEHQ